jgi:iron complex transport system substrate-binding protein
MNRIAAFLAITVVIVALPTAVVPSPTTAQSGTPADCSFPFSKTDATGTEVVVKNEPKDIVALQASTAQILWEIGAKENVVGMPVAPYTAYLNGSKQKTDILTRKANVKIETVVSLNPDLVIAPDSISDKAIQKLRAAGLTVYKFGTADSIEDIYQRTHRIGRLVGACEGAQQTVSAMKKRVHTIEQAVANTDEPRVLYYFYNFTAGKGTFINDVIQTAGGDNIATNAGIEGFAKISEEVIIQRNPQWIVVPNDASIPSGPAVAGTTAVKKNQTFTVNASYMNQPAPRVIFVLTKLARKFHPDAMADVNIQNTSIGSAPVDVTAQTSTEMTDAGTETSQETDATGPGFGVVAAAVALVAGALFVRMRS